MHWLSRKLPTGLLLLGILCTPSVLVATPAAAATPATLAISIAVLPQPPLPGKAVTYTVTVHNVGTVKADRVQLELTSDLGLTGIAYKASSGRCYRSALESACLLNTLNPGATVTAAISGKLPTDARLYSQVSVTASIASDTKLAGSTTSTLVYPLGGPSPVPTPPSPPASAAPVAAHAAGSSGLHLLQPTGFARILVICFAFVVGALIVAGKLWERRLAQRRAAGSAPADPVADPADPEQGQDPSAESADPEPESAATDDRLSV